LNILITGATGLIGQALIHTLIASDKRDITALTRDKEAAARILPDGINIVTSLSDIDINTIDAVVNLAGEPIADKRWTDSQKNLICNSRWQLTEALSELIANATNPPDVFISGSAIGYYGQQGDQEISEAFKAITPEFAHDVCRVWEEKASICRDKTRVCLLRTGVVLSPNKGALAKMLPAFKLGLGGPIANGQQYMSWIHIDDMVNIILEAMENTLLAGPINATAPNPVTNAEFSKTLAKTLNRPCVFRVPKTVLKIALGELSTLLVDGQRVIPSKLIEHEFKFEFDQLDTALDDLLKG